MKNRQQRTKNYIGLDLSLSAATMSMKYTTRNHATGKLGHLQHQPLLGHLYGPAATPPGPSVGRPTATRHGPSAATQAGPSARPPPIATQPGPSQPSVGPPPTSTPKSSQPSTQARGRSKLPVKRRNN